MWDAISTIFTVATGTLVFLTVWFVWTFNRLRALEARCDNAAGDIDAQIKRRSDLLPNLSATVKSFVGQESRLLDMIGEAQKDMNNAASISNKTKSNTNISNSLSNLFASMDQIPQLQSASHYIALRNELLNIEDQISASRRFLNLATSEFNVARNKFPGALIASVANIGHRKGYSLGADRVFHDEAPAVNL